MPIQLHASGLHLELIIFLSTATPKDNSFWVYPGCNVITPKFHGWRERQLIEQITASEESPGQHSPVHVPEEYSQFLDIFSKDKA